MVSFILDMEALDIRIGGTMEDSTKWQSIGTLTLSFTHNNFDSCLRSLQQATD